MRDRGKKKKKQSLSIRDFVLEDEADFGGFSVVFLAFWGSKERRSYFLLFE